MVLLPLRGRSRASALLQGLRNPDVSFSVPAADFALLHQKQKQKQEQLTALLLILPKA
jgi:hypothetical protein